LKKIALITGVTGQDGSYLAELLIEKGYEVHGFRRRSSSFNTGRLEHLINQKLLDPAHLHYCDITDFSSIFNVLKSIEPGEIYHLAAQSHVGVSFENPEYTGNVDALGTLRMLESLRILNSQSIRFYQASTSELYGKNITTPQNEETEFKPCSPYAIAKAYAFSMSQLYRDAYEMFVSNGILFNHESPRRGETFVSRKISRHVARVSKGLHQTLKLGNLEAVRDWGHAQDYVEGMHLIMNHSTPGDFVLATGQGHTVRNFVEAAFRVINVEIDWEGSNLKEIGINSRTGEPLIEVDQGYFRPSDVPILIGDSSKARDILGWSPKISFEDLVIEMVEADIRLLEV